MAREQDQLHWSSQFTVTPSQYTLKLSGDRIVLPQSALEQLLAAAPLREVSSQQPLRPYTSSSGPFSPRTIAAESQSREHGVHRQQQLPHPLTFRLVNTQNSRVIYAGIREFSARENEIGLSASLREALGISQDGGEANAPIVTVHAKQLPKGSYVRLRPLEAGYDTEDWKALLEHHLRSNYTTLTTGETLTVPRGQEESFKFLVDKVEPQGEGICVVDTDLEVDIVALTEEQARETLHKRLARASRASETNGGTSAGGVLELGAEVTGQVLPGKYVDYDFQARRRSRSALRQRMLNWIMPRRCILRFTLLLWRMKLNNRLQLNLINCAWCLKLQSSTMEAPNQMRMTLMISYARIASAGFLQERLSCMRTFAFETIYYAPNAAKFSRNDLLNGRITGTVLMMLHSGMIRRVSINMI
ncbi:ubiquitin fusion degradation protein UFD1-domain-containing protein [Aspergillus terricola var. indicus]